MNSAAEPRYIVGIDLGTTNSAVSYIDLHDDSGSLQNLVIEQASSEGRLYQEEFLPSFLLYPSHTVKKESLIPGIAAREAVFEHADRVIHSAKSWLCYGNTVDEPKILPWQSASVPDGEKSSAVDASCYYLNHIRNCWNREHAEFDARLALSNQIVVVTVPASFDERAQELTLRAIERAGLPEHTILLEEPLSALSSVLHDHGQILDELSRIEIKDEYRLLVIDIGGGTTDFSLFSVQRASGSGVQRIAVGKHLLLGGDNIDLSIAHTIAETNKLDCYPGSKQWAILCARSRELKERLFTEAVLPEREFLSIPSDSGNLFEGSVSLTVYPEELRKSVLEGFFQEISHEEASRRSGIRQRGLPYETISSIPYHIASFLQGRHVDAVVFNGGSVAPQELRIRLLNAVAELQSGIMPLEIENRYMAHAVSRGAALWAYRRQLGTAEIEAGYRASIYVELSRKRSDPVHCICLCPLGMKEGETSRIEVPGLEAVVGQPVVVSLCRSVSRPEDVPGAVLNIKRSELQGLPPSSIVFDHDDAKNMRVEVVLEAHLTATGRLELCCIQKDDSSRTWQLSFDTRGEDASLDSSEHESISGSLRQQAEESLSRWFSKSRKRENGKKPARLLTNLENILELPRERWSLSLLRSLADVLVSAGGRRARSVEHELAWLRTCGYLLRPGFGDPLDSRRIDNLWPQFSQGLFFEEKGACVVAWPIFWRRIAGGLSQERQQVIFRRFFKSSVEKMHIEELRLLCSLERVGEENRRKLLKGLIKALQHDRGDFLQVTSCLGRLLARESATGELHTVLGPEYVVDTFRKLEEKFPGKKASQPLAHAFLHAGRLTGDDIIDVPSSIREKLSGYAGQCGIADEKRIVLQEFVSLQDDDVSFLVGDRLPPGLRLKRSELNQSI